MTVFKGIFPYSTEKDYQKIQDWATKLHPLYKSFLFEKVGAPSGAL